MIAASTFGLEDSSFETWTVSQRVSLEGSCYHLKQSRVIPAQQRVAPKPRPDQVQGCTPCPNEKRSRFSTANEERQRDGRKECPSRPGTPAKPRTPVTCRSTRLRTPVGPNGGNCGTVEKHRRGIHLPTSIAFKSLFGHLPSNLHGNEASKQWC